MKIPEAGGSRSYSIEETITCLVNATAGQPTFRLLYNGPDKSVFNITRQVLQLDNQEYYYNGIKYATVTLPQRGDIVCQVTDKLGTYRETKHIDTEGMFLIGQINSTRQGNPFNVYLCIWHFYILIFDVQYIPTVIWLMTEMTEYGYVYRYIPHNYII